MTCFRPDRLLSFATNVYLAKGVPGPQAEHLARTLVAADLWGHSSHGIMRLFWYGARFDSGVAKMDAVPSVDLDTGPLLGMDGRDGIGQWVVQHAVDLARERAANFGIAAVSIRNSGHFGTAMFFTRQLAEAGMIGFLATNASPAIPPEGGADKLVGNNPQSWAAPTGLDAPFVLDFAHSAVARGKIYLAQEAGRQIPDGWALDAEGRPTTDPAAAIAGTLLPMAGHKGAGLAAMMDILSGVLSGGGHGPSIAGPYVADRRSSSGHLLIAIDIARLRPVEDFTTEMKQMIERWRASRRRAGTDAILYPGEPEHLHELDARNKGIELPTEMIAKLCEEAAKIGITTSPQELAV